MFWVNTFVTELLVLFHKGENSQDKQVAEETHLFPSLRRLERVFHCYIVCETKEVYKEGCLMVWANYYMFPCNSIVGLYFKGTCDIISVTMAMHKVHKSKLSEKLIR